MLSQTSGQNVQTLGYPWLTLGLPVTKITDSAFSARHELWEHLNIQMAKFVGIELLKIFYAH